MLRSGAPVDGKVMGPRRALSAMLRFTPDGQDAAWVSQPARFIPVVLTTST